MKLFLSALFLFGLVVANAEEKKSDDRKPAQTSRNQVLFERVEISSGEDKDGNQVSRIIDRDQKTVCFTYRKRGMEGASMSCLPLIN